MDKKCFSGYHYTRQDNKKSKRKGDYQFAGLLMLKFLITCHSVCISQSGLVFMHVVIMSHWMSHEIGPLRSTSGQQVY